MFLDLDYRSRFKAHRVVLKSRLECQYGLLDHLYKCSVLSEELEQDIPSQHEPLDQNVKLLNVMSQNGNLEDQRIFLDGLNRTSQGHLASYIINDGGGL